MQLNTVEISLLGALVICFVIQLYFSFFIHLKLAAVKIDEIPVQSGQPISVIVCARNEAENLRQYLPSVLEQDYADFEVIVVNDRSWDGTDEVLETLAKQYDKIKIVTVADGQKFIAGKKFAVTMGIKAASYEWLVFTDADCKPATDQWLKGMQQPANEQIEILLGYSPYFKKRGLLNALVRFETFFTAVNYLSFALKGNPYMGVGRNMAYKKSLFFKTKGFAAHMHIPSGDDDLFVNANATKYNTAIQVHKNAQVWSEPKTTWLHYLKQKKRHIGAGKFYKKSHQFILSMQIAVQFLFYALTIALLLFSQTAYIAIGIFVFNVILRSFVYPKLLKRLNYGELRWWFPLLEVILFVFLVFNAFLSIFVKKVSWK